MVCKFIVGNWKMNGQGFQFDFFDDFVNEIVEVDVDILICLLVILIEWCVWVVDFIMIVIGGQDCYVNEKGVYIGDVFVGMLKDVGVSFVIVGYFECCVDYGEISVIVKVKVEVVLVLGLILVICVGEILVEWESGEVECVVVE